MQRPIIKYNFKFVQTMNNSLINRVLLNTINTVFRYFSVLTLTGPRQSGKTFRTDYFDGLEYIQQILGKKLLSTTVLYDGDQELKQQFNAYRRYEKAFKF